MIYQIMMVAIIIGGLLLEYYFGYRKGYKDGFTDGWRDEQRINRRIK